MEELAFPNGDPKRERLDGEDEQIARVNEGEPAAEPRTTIDDLPDDMLQYILSILDRTDEAIRTSILSRRWLHIWTCIPNLNFLEYSHVEREAFLGMVSRCLLLRGSNKIMEFSLQCMVLGDASLIRSWFEAVVKCKVKKLRLDLRQTAESVLELPAVFFTCDSLTFLEVRFRRGVLLPLPSTIQLRNLKVLNLWDLVLPNDQLTQQLLDNCPLLEELRLEDCDMTALRHKELRIYCPGLRKLIIGESILQVWTDCKVTISCNNLTHFDYSGYLSNDYFVDDLPLLRQAQLYVVLMQNSYDFDREQSPFRAYKLLNGISSTRRLIISGQAVEAVAIAKEESWNLPIFRNLEYLGLIAATNYLDGAEYWVLLEKCPILETFAILRYLDCTTDEDEWLVDPVPSCFLSSLRCIEIHRYYGLPSQEVVLRVLLKNVLSLERFLIRSDVADNPLEVREEISRIPIASPNCEVHFVPGDSPLWVYRPVFI